MKVKSSTLFGALGMVIAMWGSADASEKPVPVLNRWFALGSGCRANSETKGDVSREVIASQSSDIYKARFSFPKLKLDIPTNTELDGKKTEAKECSLRINVNPPPHKRVKFVTASTVVSESKSANAELTTLTELKIGTDTLHRELKQYAANEAFTNKVRQVQMVPGSKPEEVFPKLECGQAKIIAVNLTFLTKRTDKAQSSMVELANEKSLNVVIDLEDCKSQ